MLRFYTPADRKKPFLDLYRIQSIEDYKISISQLHIDIPALKAVKNVDPNYAFVESYLSRLIEKYDRICFLGVYDFTKEVYFVNKFPHKKFVVADVSIKAISTLEAHFPNVRVCEATMDTFDAKPGDLIILNVSEAFLTQEQLSALIKKGGGVILNNSHFYIAGWGWVIHSIFREARMLSVNMRASVIGGRQSQFRGWHRTISDFMDAAENSGKYISCIAFNKLHEEKMRSGQLYSAMVAYEKEP